MMEGGLVEIWEVGGRMVTMCWPAASHWVKACTVVVMWVLVVMVEPAAYWCVEWECGWAWACGGGGDWAEDGADAEVVDERSEASESSWGDRWMTRSAQGL